MKRGNLKSCKPSGMWFDEVLIHDPNGGWQWFWKCWMSEKYSRYWEAVQSFEHFTKENKDELSKRMGETFDPSLRRCKFCLLAHCICDTLDRI